MCWSLVLTIHPDLTYHCVLLGFIDYLNIQRMSEALESVRKPESQNSVESPKETDLGLSDDYVSGSDFIEDDATNEVHTEDVLYQSNVANEARKRFYRKVISQWQKGGERQVYLSFWDYAGQSTYYSTHQAFMSANAVYLIVFDLSKDLDYKLDDSLNFAMGGTPKSSVRGKFCTSV